MIKKQHWIGLTLLTLITISLANCQTRKKYNNPIDYAVALDTLLFEAPAAMGRLDKPNKLDELSGLAASYQFSNHYWTHNDSGGENHLYLIDEKGKFLGEIELKGIKNRDWEDIATGYDRNKKKGYIYLAEMGDNQAIYKDRFIYKIPEPSLKIKKGNKTFSTESKKGKIEKIAFDYPDGVRDAETLLFDNRTQDIYIISKREDSVRVYQMPKPYSLDQVNTLIFLGKLHFHNANGGDISPDGNEILIRNYANVYYWQRSPEESIAQTLQRLPVRLPYKEEPQGEAVAWKLDASGYFTISEVPEGAVVDMLFYERK